MVKITPEEKLNLKHKAVVTFNIKKWLFAPDDQCIFYESKDKLLKYYSKYHTVVNVI